MESSVFVSTRSMAWVFLAAVFSAVLGPHVFVAAAGEAVSKPAIEPIRIAESGDHFILAHSGKPFVPWGFNYDHDSEGHLLEDYWHTGWDRVIGDFQEMKALGANVVRIHLQVGKFLVSPTEINQANLAKLRELIRLAENVGLHLDITGLGCYHKEDVPQWYDALDETDRWNVQAFFWRSIAKIASESPAVFCYDLMNEPVVPAGSAREQGWLVGPPLAGKYFVQRITLDPGERSRAEIAAAWVARLHAAIREVDSRTLITVGLLPGTPERADAWSGFRLQEIAPPLDFISVHIYPEKNKLDDALRILSRFKVDKPVVIEETFPLRCGMDEFRDFLHQSREFTRGWIGFYWGTPIAELRKANDIQSAIVASYLELWAKLAPEYRRP